VRVAMSPPPGESGTAGPAAGESVVGTTGILRKAGQGTVVVVVLVPGGVAAPGTTSYTCSPGFT